MYLFLSAMRNIVHYRKRYEACGLFLFIISFMYATSEIALFVYKKTSDNIRNSTFFDNRVAFLDSRVEIFRTSADVVIWILVIVMLYIILFHLQERKYDINVLRSMGMGKPMLIASFLFEIGIFVLTCVLVGMIFAYIFATDIILVLDEELSEIYESDEILSFGFFAKTLIVSCITIISSITMYMLQFSSMNTKLHPR